LRANTLAERAKTLFARHAELRHRYEDEIAGGKWAQMMSQTVIGYTGWQQPDREVMPEIRTVDTSAPRRSAIPIDNWYVAPGELPSGAHGFIEHGGVVAIEAAHYARAVAANGIRWVTIPNLGRTDSAVTAFPVTAPSQAPRKGSYLEYAIYLGDAGDFSLQVVLSPTLDFRGKGGLRYAVSIDGEAPQLVNVNGGISNKDWEHAVAQNAWIRTTHHHVARAGQHVIRLWLVDPALDFQRLVLFHGTLPASYLGPPESRRIDLRRNSATRH
jgi:hypothetical protein